MFADRVKQETTTEGTGTYTLSGSASGMRTFAEAFADGDTVVYCATQQDGFEIGKGVLGAGGTTLTRDEVLESSNGGAPVNWPTGKKAIFCVYASAFMPLLLGADPGYDINPPLPGKQVINITSGEVFVCTSAVTDHNEWIGQLGTHIIPPPIITWVSYDGSTSALVHPFNTPTSCEYADVVSLSPTVGVSIASAQPDDPILNVVDVSATDPVLGANNVLTTGASQYIEMCAYGDGVAVVYSDPTNGDVMMMVLGTVSGETITFSTPVQVAAYGRPTAIRVLDTGKMFVLYNTTTDSQAVIVSESGGTLTVNTPAQVASYVSNCGALEVTSTTSALVGDRTSGESLDIFALTVSDVAISVAAPTTVAMSYRSSTLTVRSSVNGSNVLFGFAWSAYMVHAVQDGASVTTATEFKIHSGEGNDWAGSTVCMGWQDESTAVVFYSDDSGVIACTTVDISSSPPTIGSPAQTTHEVSDTEAFNGYLTADKTKMVVCTNLYTSPESPDHGMYIFTAEA